MATIDRAAFVEALGALSATAGDPRRFPIVGCAVIGGPTASTTDMEAFTTVTLPLDIPRTAVDCRQIYGVVRAMDGDDVTLATDGSRLTVTGGRAKYVLPTLDAADFPALPVVPPLAAVAADAAPVLKLAARLDTNRYGIRLSWFDGVLNVAATDGYRLVTSGSMDDTAVTVSGRSLKCLDGVGITHMGASDDWLFVSDGAGSVVGVRRIGNDYPDVTGVVKTTTANVTGTAHVDGERLRAALGRVTLMAGESARVEITIGDGKLQFRSHDPQSGEATDSVPVEGDARIVTAVNGRYLADWARYAGDHATISVNGGGGSPLLFTTDGQLEGASYVLMPMR